MYNITLISTIHSEIGKCNHNELYTILESINPEVIFDELPSHYFDMYFSDSFDMHFANSILLNRNTPIVPIEVKCIKKYKQNYNVKILPIDIDVTPNLSKHQDEILFMLSTFFKYEDYKELDNEKETLIAQEGFHYLNSDVFLGFLEKKEILEKNIMESEIEKDRLLNIYKLFHAEQYNNRENEMLQNIYNYSKENQYNQAVFLIGAEHKKSIMKKITEYEKLSGIKLNWSMYGNK
jgi:hypothetical protein